MDPVKERVIQHLKLAQIIAAKYFNIQGVSREEVLSEAQLALVKAAMAYREEKGPFAPFAGVAIRNALNSLFNKQLRNAKIIAKSLDETIHGATQFGTYIGNLGQNIKDPKVDMQKIINEREKALIVVKEIKKLSLKEKYVAECIKKGMTLSEIAITLNVSKQAIFKTVKKIEVKLIKLRSPE